MWETLKFHLLNAKYVQCYDGFIGRITMDVLQGLGIIDVFVVRMPGASQNNGRTMFFKPISAGKIGQTKWPMVWAMDIGRQVAAGKNVMVFYPFKREKDSRPSMF